MFKVATNPRFSHPVKVMVPVDGGHREDTCRATFNVIPADVMDTFDLTTPGGTDAFLGAAVVRLDELADEDGKPLSWNDALRAQVLALPYVRIALCGTYFKAVTQAKSGN